MNALTRIGVAEKPANQGQVGGDHYTKLAIQPVEFTMRNGWDPCSHSVLKYITRHGDKNGVQDLRKGRHFVELYMQYAKKRSEGDGIRRYITMRKYIAMNRLGPLEGIALLLLEELVQRGPHPLSADRVMEAIDRLIAKAAKTCVG